MTLVAAEGESVAIVVDRAYGERLESLRGRYKLWVSYSEVNQAAVERLWSADPSAAADMELTIGVQQYQPEDIHEDFEQMLGSVLEHFVVRRVVVIGFGEADEKFVDGVMADDGFSRDGAAAGLEYVRASQRIE